MVFAMRSEHNKRREITAAGRSSQQVEIYRRHADAGGAGPEADAEQGRSSETTRPTWTPTRQSAAKPKKSSSGGMQIRRFAAELARTLGLGDIDARACSPPQMQGAEIRHNIKDERVRRLRSPR